MPKKSKKEVLVICDTCEGTGSCKFCDGTGENAEGNPCVSCERLGNGICGECNATGKISVEVDDDNDN